MTSVDDLVSWLGERSWANERALERWGKSQRPPMFRLEVLTLIGRAVRARLVVETSVRVAGEPQRRWHLSERPPAPALPPEAEEELALKEPPAPVEIDERALYQQIRDRDDLHPWDREFRVRVSEEIGLGLPGQEAVGVAYVATVEAEGPRPAGIAYPMAPAPVEEPPAPPPTEEARVLASLSVDTWRTRAEVAQLAGLEEDLVGWVLLRLLDAGRVRWARAVWSLPP